LSFEIADLDQTDIPAIVQSLRDRGGIPLGGVRRRRLTDNWGGVEAGTLGEGRRLLVVECGALTMVDWIKAHPWRWALIVLAVAFVLFLLLFGPFLGGGGGEGGTY
jgi:hypothetical protein